MATLMNGFLLTEIGYNRLPTFLQLNTNYELFRSLTAARLRKEACRNVRDLDSWRIGNEIPLGEGKE
jgi:hypothetical protein